MPPTHVCLEPMRCVLVAPLTSRTPSCGPSGRSPCVRWLAAVSSDDAPAGGPDAAGVDCAAPVAAAGGVVAFADAAAEPRVCLYSFRISAKSAVLPILTFAAGRSSYA